MRPARDSLSLGTSSTLAEPVSRKRPGTRPLSTSVFIEGKISGTRCTSSRMTRSGRPATKPAGSVLAFWYETSSSKPMYLVFSRRDFAERRIVAGYAVFPRFQNFRCAYGLSKRGFSALAGAVNEDDRRIFQCLDQVPGNAARIKFGFGHRLIAGFIYG